MHKMLRSLWGWIWDETESWKILRFQATQYNPAARWVKDVKTMKMDSRNNFDLNTENSFGEDGESGVRMRSII